MNGQMPQQAPRSVPDFGDYKKQQTSILASLVPQIMNALGGGDPYTQKVLSQQQQQFEARDKQQNLRGFMRMVASPATGEINPQLIMEQASLWGVDPQDAMTAIQQLQAFRQAKRGKMRDYSQQMPGGGVRTAQMYDDEVEGMPGQWQLGKITPAPKGEMPFGSSKMGIFDRRTGQVVQGAPEREQSLERVPDGRGGWKFVRPKEGLSGLNNPPKGMRIETGPDGTVIQTNVAAGGDSSALTPATKTTLQKTMIETQDTYDRLVSGMGDYEESFLKGQDKIGFALTALKEKWDAGSVSSDDKAKLEKYTGWKRTYVSALNNYIKQITGAAMSGEEAKRLLKGIPNPGIGLFDGDSPTEFKAKLDSTIKELGRVRARSFYILKNNITNPSSVPTGAMDRIIEARGQELEKSMKTKKPGASDDEIQSLVRSALAQEFGMK